jgi:lipopolysaccharide biosynthesis protein
VIYEQYYLASQYGISGFVPYLYWFCDGRVLMEDVIVQFSGGNVPYALCWANENWTRRWDGQEKDVLIEQKYKDPQELADYLEHEHFSNPNYIRDSWGRPLLIVYRPHHSTKSIEFVKSLKACFSSDVLLLGGGSFEDYPKEEVGVDDVVQFPPHRQGYPTPHKTGVNKVPKFAGAVYDYKEMADFFINDNRQRYKTVCPAWDNTPRRMNKGHVFFEDADAFDIFENWVSCAAEYSKSKRNQFMFINAWNEWAEGAFLEPDIVRGRARLEALSRGLNPTK